MQTRQLGRSQIQSADAAGISERTGRDLDHGGRAVRGPRTYRTRVDPFASVWLSVIEPLLLRSGCFLGNLWLVSCGRWAVGCGSGGRLRVRSGW
jgi:hypothetical protein